jgi:hypothetical protein
MADEIRIPHKAFVSLVSLLTSAYPNPEDDNPPGPWDPVIRKVLTRISRFGPQPEPWVLAGLNPQPLPPRAAIAAALAQEVVDSLGSLQVLAEALPQEGQRAVRNHLARFIDDCGNGRIPFPWPWPWPPIRKERELGPVELVVIGAQLANAARGFADSSLQKDLEEGGARLIEMGVSQMG